MRRICLTIEYDGTDFAGFQTQASGSRTVQETLSQAIATITGEMPNVVGAGRTDSGVHALGQVIHFDSATRLMTERLVSALNGVLPKDVAVSCGSDVESGFHARFSAIRRSYVYLIHNRTQRPALWNRYSLHEPRELNVGAMRDAANALVGVHDFSSFANSGGDPGSTTVRRLEKLQVRRASGGSMIVVRCTANAFLRSMVRNLVGSLVDVGRGALSPNDLQAILDSKDRTKNPSATIAARGLCLLKVDYAAAAADAASSAAEFDEEG